MLRMMRRCKAFSVDQSGGVFIFFAVSLLVLTIAVGLAVDLARMQLIQSRVQTSLDAAVLAAGTKINARNPQDVFDQYFNGNLPLNTMGTTFGVPTVDAYDGDGNLVTDLDDPVNRSRVEVLNLRVSGQLPTTILGIVGINSTDVFAESEVQVGRRAAVEVVAVMDNSGSMGVPPASGGGINKIDILKTSMKRFFRQLYRDEPSDPNTMVGIVPFDSRVNFAPPQAPNASSAQEALPRERHVPFLSSTATITNPSSSCFGRTFLDCAYLVKAGGSQQRTNLSSTQGYRTVRSDLDSRIDTMKPVAYTNIAYGMEVGHDMLNPARESLFDHNSSPTAFGEPTTVKAIVLITDALNEACSLSDYAGFPALQQQCIDTNNTRNTETRNTCTTLKSQGVRIFTIALDFVPSNTLLRDCASGPEFFFQANDGDDFEAALSTILEAVNDLRKTR